MPELFSQPHRPTLYGSDLFLSHTNPRFHLILQESHVTSSPPQLAHVIPALQHVRYTLASLLAGPYVQVHARHLQSAALIITSVSPVSHICHANQADSTVAFALKIGAARLVRFSSTCS